MNRCQEARDKLKKMTCTSYIGSIANRSIAANPIVSHNKAMSRDYKDSIYNDARVPVDLSCFFYCSLQVMCRHIVKVLDSCRLLYVEWVILY